MIQFFSKRFRIRPDGSRDESGIAMIIAITVVMLMTIIPLAIVQGAISQLPLSRHDQDHESALAAAEAGVDDYMNRLGQNSNYWTYSATNPPTPANPAFTGWVRVAGADSNAECFRYTPNTVQTGSTGIVYLTASGKRLTNPTGACSDPGVIRTVSLGLRRQGFLDYLWLTDYEITDPALTGADSSSCAVYSWQWNPVAGVNKYGPSNLSTCGVVYWSTSAVMNGPVHSNDGLYVCGSPTFNDNVDTYYNSATSNNAFQSKQFGGPGPLTGTGANPNAVLNPLSCTNTPSFNGRAGDPASGTILPFPPANTSIEVQADASQGGTGCLYTGPTTITLVSNGTMNVTSPKTLSSNCAVGNGVALPGNGVIYVQNVPAATTNPNHSSCTGSACNGDVSVSGTLKGQLTISTDDDIDITGNLLYHQYPTGNDVLGLIAKNDIAVVHSASANVTSNLTIDAAMMSLKHSFYVQNWDQGASSCTIGDTCSVAGSDNLIINGVIAQEFRGPVGTFDTGTGTVLSGYNKQYTYDSRLKYLSPPYFLNPTQSAWLRISYAEVPPKQVP